MVKLLLFTLIFLFIGTPLLNKLLRVRTTLRLVIRYESSVNDTIQKESIRLIANNKIEYWNKDSVIVHIADKYKLDTIWVAKPF